MNSSAASLRKRIGSEAVGCELEGMNRTILAFMLALLATFPAGQAEAQFHSLYFDGVDDHVELNETVLDQYFSFEGWVRFAADGIPFGSDAGSHIISIGADDEGNWASFAVGVSLSIEGTPQLTCEFGQADQYAANEAFPIGEWVHFAVVFDEGVLRVYQNGLNVLITQTPFSSPSGGGNNFFIGARGDDWGAGAYRFHGEIAEVSQWQVALNSSEIQALAGCSQTVQEEGLLSLWTFETGEGSVLVDQVGVNSGQIEGAVWSGLMPLFYGCTDSAACNFDACANTHDESCLYPPVIDLGDDIETCNDSVILDAGEGFGSYLWSTGETSQTITVSESGLYEATVSAHPANAWSLSFDGQDDWVDFGHSEVFHPESDFTWSMYFQIGSHYYQADSSPVQMHQPILNKAIGYNLDGYGISYGNWGGSTAPNYYLWYGQGLNSTMQEAWSDVNLIGLNQWYHLAVVRRNDDVEIYLDGALVTLSSSTESFDDVIENSTGLLLGATADVLDLCGVCPDSTFFDGLVDNLSLWNRALAIDEIQEYAQCPSQGEGDGLVGLWNFEEGQGDTAYDLSGNGNHGAIHGAGWSHQVPQQNCQGCESSDDILVDFDDCDGYCGEGTVWDEILETCVSVCSDIDSGFGCDDTTACNYTPQGLSASFYVDSLNYSIPFLLSQGFSPSGLVGLVYGGGVIYDWEEQDSLLTLHIVHPPEYSDAPVPNMGLSIGSACGAGGEFGGNFFEAAVECEELVLEGHDDWSLPSIDQVEQVYQNLFYSSEYPLNVCATGAFGYFKGIDYLSSTETCRCYFGTGVTVCNSNALGAYEFFPVRDTSLVINDSEFECEYGCHYCGEGTLWDDTLGECVSLNSEVTCGEGTVWDPFNQECIVAIPTDTDFDGCVAAGDLLNLLGTFGSCPPIPFSGPCQGQDHVTYQGYDYEIVAIGDQCWFAENLQAESYRNGDEIPYCANSCQWGNSEEGARSGYGDTYPTTGAPCGEGVGSSGYCFAPTADVVALFGHLYNWYAVVDERELCPSGWTVPSTVDFETLIEFAEEAGTATAAYLKADHTWLQENADTGLLGFDALAGGYGGNLGGFDGDGYLTMFWGSTQSTIGANAEHLQIEAGATAVFLNNNHKQYAQYVRCIKD